MKSIEMKIIKCDNVELSSISTCADIENYYLKMQKIKESKEDDFAPIFVDYGTTLRQCIQDAEISSMYNALSKLTEGLRNVAVKENCCIFAESKVSY